MNKAIIDYAQDHAEELKLKENTIPLFNYVRMRKRMHLLRKLEGIDKGCKIKEIREFLGKSSALQNF